MMFGALTREPNSVSRNLLSRTWFFLVIDGIRRWKCDGSKTWINVEKARFQSKKLKKIVKFQEFG